VAARWYVPPVDAKSRCEEGFRASSRLSVLPLLEPRPASDMNGRTSNDWTVSGDTNFQQYFGDLDLSRLKDARVLDYSLGVLHHLQDTGSALSGLVRLVRPGGRLRVYLYWQPGGWRENVLALVSLFRRVTTRLPFGVLRALCWILSVGLWTGVIVPYRILRRLGIRGVAALPLFQYTMYPFVILYNDQFDRFSAPLEKRYHLEEDRDLLEAAGLVDVRVWPRHG
jgi:SAM-dependent methyltransferase